MGEYKKVKEYQRSIACRHLAEFLLRCKTLNGLKDTSCPESYFKIKEATVFGSLVNSNKEKVHDVDIHIVIEKEIPQEEINLLMSIAPKSYSNFNKLIWVHTIGERYLKGSSSVLSLDSQDSIMDLTGKKIKIIDNYKFLYDNINSIFKSNNLNWSSIKTALPNN
jgi:predicted nucleotidyltransferase